jgi:hypothetical protein
VSSADDSKTYAIKIREPGMNRFGFLSGGSLAHRRVHAEFTPDLEKARGAAERLAAQHPDCRVRVTDFRTGRPVARFNEPELRTLRGRTQ